MATDAPDAAPPPGWKRLNFFKGLVTYYTDWIDREDYRIAKARWHNQRRHSAGVLVGYDGDLRVNGRGDLSIEVQPGAALDAQGRELVLAETQIKQVRLDGLKLPETVYIVARYVEEPVDFIAYRHDLSIRGHRRIQEGCAIDVIARAPAADEVELARVLLPPGVRAIVDAADGDDPQPGELDLRFVTRAGQVGSDLDRPTQIGLGSMLTNARQTLGALWRRSHVLAAQDALHAVITMSTVYAADLMDSRSVLELFRSLLWHETAVYVDIKLNHPKLVALPQWGEWVNSLRALQLALQPATKLGPRERIVTCINTQHRLNDLLRVLFATGGL